MARNVEIERKFLVKRLPAGWKSCPSSQLVQGYFKMSGRAAEIRLRRKDATHFITIKSGHAEQRVEVEIEIEKAQFDAIWPLTLAARIAKRRYRIPYAGHTIELDVYQGPHRGLQTADVEFKSVRACRAFQPPDWLGREISGSRRYANAVLARSQSFPGKKDR